MIEAKSYTNGVDEGSYGLSKRAFWTIGGPLCLDRKSRWNFYVGTASRGACEEKYVERRTF
jgi:hypothetical protein